MKYIIKHSLTVLCLLLAVVTHAQAPQGIPYQAVARNSSGNILSSQNIRVRFSIRDSVATGTIVYRETFTPTTNALGLFNVNVGTGTVVTGTFSGINWGTNAKFMQVEMDPTGGTSYVDMGTTQMMSVPYALYAGSAAGLMPGSSSAITQVYTISGTWTKPTGFSANSMVLIECIGGGGGGAGWNGGGGGGYKHLLKPLYNLGATEVINIGSGGVSYSNGGNTSFGTWCVGYGGGCATDESIGNGGAGGGYASSPVIGSKSNDSGGEGWGGVSGSPSGKGGYYTGGGGAFSFTGVATPGGNSVYGGGGGGERYNGNGGVSVYAGNGGAGGFAGSNGVAPGGGGGGGHLSSGTGARGQVKITIWNIN